MDEHRELHRRSFLRLSAAAVAATGVAACQGGGSAESGQARRSGGGEASGKSSKNPRGSATQPIKPPVDLSEAPMLKRMVENGDLPPLAQRLPERPYVVPHHWLEAGKYGGALLINTRATDDAANKEYMYGHSPLRWLNDGLDIGPGLVESWESNEDTSEWTLHFRKGLKWSDGHPWSTDDIMYWWTDLVLNKEHPEEPPDDLRSGKNTVADLTAPDSDTLVIRFDTPSPIMPLRLAAWTKRGNGPTWMQPKHYLKQFHPAYNDQITSDDWFQRHDEKANWGINPESPTMTGWRLKSYHEGRSLTFERNPYYWCIGKDGDQLPYIDSIVMTAVDDAEVNKLQVTHGKVDYVHGPFVQITLADVSSLKEATDTSGLETMLWNSGSGTASMFMLNYDYPDDEMRALIREPKFRQALSHAFNRDEAQKSVYYKTGTKSTGTTHPKAIEYEVNDHGRALYRKWRDAYVSYDPEKAKKLLDELDVVDRDHDGMRELPSGAKLKVLLQYPADASAEDLKLNNLRKRDWEAVGVSAQLDPGSPASWGDQWNAGKLMSYTTWEVSDTPLIYPAPVVPVPPAHWAPLHVQAFALQAANPKKLQEQADVSPWKRQPPWMLAPDGSTIDRLWKIYAKARVASDQLSQIHQLWKIYKIHIEEGPFFIGVIANQLQVIAVRHELHNVPRRANLTNGGWVNAWTHPTPAVYDPETFFWKDPDKHRL